MDPSTLIASPAFWAVVVLILLVSRSLYKNSPSLPLPPGPRRDPIIGNLRQFPIEYQEKTFAKWAHQYGTDHPHSHYTPPNSVHPQVTSSTSTFWANPSSFSILSMPHVTFWRNEAQTILIGPDSSCWSNCPCYTLFPSPPIETQVTGDTHTQNWLGRTRSPPLRNPFQETQTFNPGGLQPQRNPCIPLCARARGVPFPRWNVQNTRGIRAACQEVCPLSSSSIDVLSTVFADSLLDPSSNSLMVTP